MADSLTNFLGKFQHQNVKVLLFAVTTFRHNHIMGKLEDVTFVIKNISLSEGSLHKNLMFMTPYMQKAGDCGDISPQFFLDFPQNFRLRT